MRRIETTEFEAQCGSLLDSVFRTGESITVTRDGAPIVDLVPHRPVKKQRKPLFDARGVWAGKVEVTGDIISPAFDPNDLK